MPALLSPTARRLLCLEDALRRRRTSVTVPVLTEVCACSPATVKRDLTMLRDELGAVIVWNRTKHTYELRNLDWPGIRTAISTEAEAV